MLPAQFLLDMRRTGQQFSATGELLVLAAGLALLGCAIFNTPSTDAGHATLPQLPSFRITDTGNYRVLSDATDADVRHIVQVLDELRQQFRQEFAALLDPGHSPGPTEVLFFNRESDYRAYTRRVAPALNGSAGCYVSTANRLAILNQTADTDSIRVRQQRLAGVTDTAQRFQAAAYLTAWHNAVEAEARASTDRLIRHEGTHQLCHAYALESQFPVEPTWLTEGLAQYCETTPIGAPHEPLLKTLRQARTTGTLIPLAVLLNHRDAAGFFALGDDKLELAYAESWALTFFLRQHHRPSFDGLLRHYRALTRRDETLADLGTLLVETLGTDLPHLDAEWQSFLAAL
jgi:hypothetical protein